MHWQRLKIFYSGTTWAVLTKFDTKHPWVKGYKEPINSQKEYNGFSSPNQHYDSIVCVYWFELFSEVSYVAHGPLHFILNFNIGLDPTFWLQGSPFYNFKIVMIMSNYYNLHDEVIQEFGLNTIWILFNFYIKDLIQFQRIFFLCLGGKMNLSIFLEMQLFGKNLNVWLKLRLK